MGDIIGIRVSDVEANEKEELSSGSGLEDKGRLEKQETSLKHKQKREKSPENHMKPNLTGMLLARKSTNNLSKGPLRNTKNLSLNLKGISNNQLPNSVAASSETNLPFRNLNKEGSLKSRRSQNNINTKNSVQSVQSPQLSRRKTMLSLSIPSSEASNKLGSGNKAVKSSPTSPRVDLASTVRSDSSSNYGEEAQTSVTYVHNVGRAQTIFHDFTKMVMSDNHDEFNMNAYPDGPVDMCKGKLFLYSEPTLDRVKEFDVVINVAKEIKPPFPDAKLADYQNTELYDQMNKDIYKRIRRGDDDPSYPEYYYLPWGHTYKVCEAFPVMVGLMTKYVDEGKRVMVHCQCGVSRSASLVIAYIMAMKKFSLTEGYQEAKGLSRSISPNLALIFQLMEWGDHIGYGFAKSPGFYDPKYKNKQVGQPLDDEVKPEENKPTFSSPLRNTFEEKPAPSLQINNSNYELKTPAVLRFGDSLKTPLNAKFGKLSLETPSVSLFELAKKDGSGGFLGVEDSSGWKTPLKDKF